MIEFAEDWLMHEAPLGEGAYGEVKLLVNKRTRDKVACKIINYKEDPNAEGNIQKEVLIHRSLNHENIIRYLGRRKETLKQYIYLEYAAQGELFQLIEPDIGMPSGLAQSYTKQLLSGIQYLHSRGVVHRDIKPENLLINSEGVLKISDFGMATIFRCKGRERLLDRKCGTRPYLAPEVLDRPYKGPPADIWSCGIVLIAMLTGELPWSDTVSPEFEAYSEDKYITLTPWSKLGNSTLSLVRKILMIDPEKRLTIDAILKHPWMKFKFDNDSQETDTNGEPTNPAKRWNSMLETETRVHREVPDVALSQPNLKPFAFEQLINAVKVKKDQICFSQPIHNEDLFLGSQIQFTQSKLTLETFNKLIKRMTRFYVTSNHEKTLEMLCSVLDTIHYSWHLDPSGAVTVSTTDNNKNDLVFKANIIDMEGRILVDFRLMKGCGINFKRKFIKLKTCLSDIIDNDN